METDDGNEMLMTRNYEGIDVIRKKVDKTDNKLRDRCASPTEQAH